MGGIPELGGRKEMNRGKMKWTEGHLWVLKDVIVPASSSVFTYKYVVAKDNGEQKWEKGYNRIADLVLLTKDQNQEGEAVPVLHLHDRWESYTVNFSIYYPLADE